jgi:hypothetical protein
VEQTAPGLSDIEQELRRFPPAVGEDFRQAATTLGSALAPHELQAWAQQGLAIAQRTVRSWESASEYFRASPLVLPALSFSNLLAWGRSGESLCESSPTVATAYFRASPGALKQLRPSQIAAWSVLGQRLYTGTWKSSALASRFFEASGELLACLTFPELERFHALITLMAQRSYDMALECLDRGPEVFPLMGESRDSFTSLAMAVAEGSWRGVKGCFEAGVVALPRIERSQRPRFIILAERLARQHHPSIPAFLSEGSHSLGQLQPGLHSFMLNLGEALLQLHPPAVPELLRNAPTVLGRVTPQQMEVWFAEGARLLRENKDAGTAFFRLESSRCLELLESLSAAVELASVKDLLRMYSHALAGVEMEVAPVQELAQKGIGWVSTEGPTTEGTTVYLPPTVSRYGTKGENFAWLKVVDTHQVSHVEFGSFAFTFDRPATLFRDLRPKLAARAAASPVAPKRAPEEKGGPALPQGLSPKMRIYPYPAPGSGQALRQAQGAAQGTAEAGWVNTDMHRFFSLFPERPLALDIFTVVEDGRLDARVLREYAGIREAYRRVQQNSLAERPVIEELPARQALVEFLLRLSLRTPGKIPVPGPYVKEARAIARVARRVMGPLATVEDAAEATLRIYAILAKVPNEAVPPEEFQEMDPAEGGEYQDGEDESLMEGLGEAAGEAQGTPQEAPYQSPQQVDYRGEFKPEMVQLLAKLRESKESAGQQATTPLTKEMLEALLAQSAELKLQFAQGEIPQNMGNFANNLLRAADLNVPPPPGYGQGPLVHVDEDEGPLEVTEPNTHLYDEWDFRADDYKPRWCMVRERAMAEGDVDFWYQTLQSDAGLVAQIRRQFELVVPETFRKVRPLADGEDFDLDHTIQFIIDVRTGAVASDRIYWRRNKIERDVAVVFLLDMSASTAEAIDEARRPSDDWDAPTDPVEYMLWLRTRRGEGSRRPHKRIIDLEKESTVLLIQALETLGDKYGIYGFSGYGRENVEFYTIKDINEPLTDKVRRRVSKIAPLHATRMGPSIRHATTKLAAVQAKTKVLFLISDGRPQDRGYSREGVEKEYAVHDTHMALVEARRQGMVPFCLTVDKAGHDYLKAMCGDMGYEVLADLQSLPRRLPELYKRLTV